MEFGEINTVKTENMKRFFNLFKSSGEYGNVKLHHGTSYASVRYPKNMEIACFQWPVW